MIAEGWRFIPHSYAIIHQWQCLALLRRTDVDLHVRDLPYFNPHWTRTNGLFDTAAENTLKAIPTAGTTDEANATLRITYPYDLSPSRAARTWVFGTAEYGCVSSLHVKGVHGLADMKQSHCGIITPSRWSAAGFLNAGVDETRLAVVPHGVEPSVFRPQPDLREAYRKRLNLSGFTFLNIGAMYQNKGIDLLLQAFAEIVDRHPHVHLILKGNDTLYSSIKLINSYLSHLPSKVKQRIIPRLTYLGASMSMDQMSALYQCADAYVSPYRAEGFNMPVLEAAGCGIPVLCTAGGPTDEFTNSDFALRIVSSPRQMTQQGTEGKYLEPSLDHLIELMLQVIEDESWRTKAQKAGPAFVTAAFTWDHVVDRLVKIMLCD